MALIVRSFRPDEAPTFFDIHARAIRGLAAPHYPADVITSWVGVVNEATIRRFLKNADAEIRIIAELDGVAVGLGCLVVQGSELRACYVVPEAARKGVGSALVCEMERVAVEHGLDHLALHASINAEPFYRALGYQVTAREDHVLGSGILMAAVRMRKTLPVTPEPKRIGLTCPKCQRAVAVVTHTSPDAAAFHCPRCDYRWTAHGPSSG